MKRSLTIILLLVLIIPLPFSCVDGSDNADFLRIENFDLTTGKILLDSSSDYYTLGYVPMGDTIPSKKFGLVLKVSDVSFVSLSSELSFVGSAFAKRLPPELESSIALISVYADSDIETEIGRFSAGSNLISIFEASFARTHPEGVISFLSSTADLEHGSQIFLHLKNEVQHPIELTFSVKVTMSDGTIFDKESEEVILQ
ncbi:MAG: hypothetical protein ABJ004_15505 [Cyclobacteriaceae bacterium]